MRNLRSRILAGVEFSALFLFLATQCGWAQQAGAVVGTVADATGAVVPGVKITATNIATQQVGVTTSSPDGTYRISGLLVGVYRLTCEKQGFKMTTVDKVTVDVGTAVAVNIALQVGTSVQSVEVTATAAPLDKENPEVETTLENKAVMDLPIRIGVEGTTVNTGRRQIESFALLVPGAQGDVFDHRYNGGVDYSNEVLFDGVPQVSLDYPGFIGQSGPPYESVDEFKVNTSTFSAVLGRGQGVEIYHFKSGTNNFHGDLFEFIRNTAFDARPFFSPTTALNHQNEAGGTVGGPVWIPHVYNGHNKLFFNFAYSWYEDILASASSLLTLPTAAMRNGNFSGLTDSSGNLVPIFDPICGRGAAGAHTCGAAEARTQFPGNIIPMTDFDPISTQVLALIPPAESTSNVNNYLGGASAFPTIDKDYDWKIDFLPTPNNRFSFNDSRADAINHAYVGSPITGPLGTLGASPDVGDFWTMNYTRTFSPTVVNTFGASANLVDEVQDWGDSSEYINTKIDFPGIAFGNNFPSGAPPRYPGINFNGPIAPDAFLGMGQWGLHTRFLGYAFNDNLIWTRGRHTITIGGDDRRTEENNGQCTSCVGDFTFDNFTTSNPLGTNFLNQGHPFASFLLGIADGANRTSADPWRGFRTASQALYIQDDIKWSKKLTINIGGRWDMYEPLNEIHDRLATFDPNLANPAAGGILGGVTEVGTCSTCVGRQRFFDLHWHNLAPRFGFAYAVNDKTVIRGGFSIIYTNGGANYIFGPEVTNSFNAPYVATQDFVSSTAGATPGYGSWDIPFPTAVYPTLGPSSVNGGIPDYFGRNLSRSPYMQNWTLGFQRQLPGSFLLTASYVGNRGVRLASDLENIDQVDPKWLSLGSEMYDPITCLSDGSCPNAIAAGVKDPYPGFSGALQQALRPYPQYLGINSNNLAEDAFSSYNALQISAQRRYTSGLTTLVSYTGSKQIGDTASGFTTFSAGPINAFNRKAEKAINATDVPQMLTIAGIYELPVGPGKHFATRGGAVGKVIGGGNLVISYATQAAAPKAFALPTCSPSGTPGVTAPTWFQVYLRTSPVAVSILLSTKNSISRRFLNPPTIQSETLRITCLTCVLFLTKMRICRSSNTPRSTKRPTWNFDLRLLTRSTASSLAEATPPTRHPTLALAWWAGRQISPGSVSFL